MATKSISATSSAAGAQPEYGARDRQQHVKCVDPIERTRHLARDTGLRTLRWAARRRRVRRARVDDVWQVMGLRGTGSDRYTIDDLFVPGDHAFTREGLGWREPGPLYRLSIVFLHAIAFGAVALGIARAMLESFVDLARHKRPTRGSFAQPLRENNAIQSHIGRAEARLRAAQAYLHASARDAWAEASQLNDGEVSLERRIDMRAASTHAIGEAEKVADICYRLAGASAIFDRQPFERRFRDMHAVTQQIQGHLSNYETIGRYRLDLPIDLSI